MFGLAIARKNPNAEITAVDWPSVLQVAEQNAERFGVKNRFKKMSGSAFEVDFGKDYDVVLFTNFLHHFDIPTCEQLTRKAHASLKPGGKLAILEFIPNDDRVSPPQATFALTMLISTPAGDAYTFAELQSICKNSGFSKVERHDLLPTPQSLVVATK
jgi:2-polyprenyl-3-methyl-5-hydroxy-6-metoxy-1,4-benzoquinol methylase